MKLVEDVEILLMDMSVYVCPNGSTGIGDLCEVNIDVSDCFIRVY